MFLKFVFSMILVITPPLWLVGWFYRRPHTSYSLLGVVQLPTDVRIYGDTHSSVLRVFREYFYYLPPDNDVQCCHLVSPPGNAELLCNVSAIFGVLTTALRVNAAVPIHHTGGSCEEGQSHCSVSIYE